MPSPHTPVPTLGELRRAAAVALDRLRRRLRPPPPGRARAVHRSLGRRRVERRAAAFGPLLARRREERDATTSGLGRFKRGLRTVSGERLRGARIAREIRRRPMNNFDTWVEVVGAWAAIATAIGTLGAVVTAVFLWCCDRTCEIEKVAEAVGAEVAAFAKIRYWSDRNMPTHSVRSRDATAPGRLRYREGSGERSDYLCGRGRPGYPTAASERDCRVLYAPLGGEIDGGGTANEKQSVFSDLCFSSARVRQAGFRCYDRGQPHNGVAARPDDNRQRR